MNVRDSSNNLKQYALLTSVYDSTNIRSDIISGHFHCFNERYMQQFST